MDATYRSDLRELNELNFARFDAKVEQRFAESEARLERRFAEADVKLERRLAGLEVKMIRWMFAFWSTTMLAFAGLALAVLRAR